MKIKKKKVENIYFGYPTTVSLILTKKDERLNVMAAAWHMPVSASPPIYCCAITKKRFTYHLIKESGEFTINFIPYKDVRLSVIAGRTSGRDIDKFKEYNIETEPPFSIKTPVLKNAYASLECSVYDIIPVGDHDIIAGEIKAVQYEKDYFTEDGLLRTEKITPLLYIGMDNYITIKPQSKILLRSPDSIA